MEITYQKDLRYNYMVITEENLPEVSYEIRMLETNQVEGILSPDLRTIDNKIWFYYNITGKQAIHHIFDKGNLNFETVKSLFQFIIRIIENADEYLLPVDSFILEETMIYKDTSSNQVFLTYLPGYQKDIKLQICSFIEYIMNRVDYKEKEAVLFVYNLYSIGKKEEFSFDYLRKEIMENKKMENGQIMESAQGIAKGEIPDAKVMSGEKEQSSSREMSIRHEVSESDDISRMKKAHNDSLPTKMEQISTEKEILTYSLSTYIITVSSILGAIIILWCTYHFKLIYNQLGTRIEIGKLMGVFLVLFCILGYLMVQIWDKKKRVTRLITEREYIDPMVQEQDHSNYEMPIMETFLEQQEEKTMVMSFAHQDIIQPTTVLSVSPQITGAYLLPLDQEKGSKIYITKDAFVIGKMKENVDYYLQEEVISRYHAKITSIQEEYFLMDLNSTNGTCLNQELLPLYEAKRLSNGDEISFANIRYQFFIK